MNNIIFYLSLFNLGKISTAPGTLTSFIVAILWYFVPTNLIIQIFIIFIIMTIGFILSYFFSKNKESPNDPSYIVIDEAAGMCIALFMLPKSILIYFFAFLLFRFFDIFKPSIIKDSEKLKNGVGIMLDDIISGLITLAIISITLK